MAEKESSADERGIGYVVRALAAGSGATAGLLAAGPAGSAIGAAGAQLAVDAVSDLLSAVSARRLARAGVPLVLAAEELEMDVTDLTDHLAADPGYDQVTAICVTAASNTTLEAKLRALAKCLVNGIKDDARLDSEAMLADALAVVETPHLRILEFLNKSYQDDHARPSLTSVHIELSELRSNVRPLLSALSGKALVLETPTYRADLASDRVSARYFQLTEFGHEVLLRIHTAAGDADWEVRDAKERSRLQRERSGASLAARTSAREDWKAARWRKTLLVWFLVRDWIDARVGSGGRGRT